VNALLQRVLVQATAAGVAPLLALISTVFTRVYSVAWCCPLVNQFQYM